MKSQKVDRVATRLLLQSVRDVDLEKLTAVTMPTLVACGADDGDNGSAPDLAAALPDGRYSEVPGNHMSSVTRPEFGEAIAQFLSETAAR
jgi:pimeloyl-ACP methyl ester carboxylesterase